MKPMRYFVIAALSVGIVLVAFASAQGAEVPKPKHHYKLTIGAAAAVGGMALAGALIQGQHARPRFQVKGGPITAGGR
jgi:hypothetical protein